METITSRKEFEAVFSQGRRLNSSLVRIRIAHIDEGSSPKVAFVAPKRLGCAVYRNRCKRLLREAARRCNLPLETCSVIMFATNATHDAHPDEIASALQNLIQRFGHA